MRITVLRFISLKPPRWRALGYTSVLRGVSLRGPNRMERAICRLWNRTMCAMFGHERILEHMPDCWDEHGRFACPHCSTRLVPLNRAARALPREEP